MKQDEFSTLPEETRGSVDEFTRPGPEFEGHAQPVQDHRRKTRILALAAGLLFLWLLVFPQGDAAPDKLTEPPATDTPSAPATSDALPSATAPVAEQHPSENAPAETEVPAPAAATEPPTCQAVFFAFSDALRAKLSFTAPDKISSVRAELWDSTGEVPEQVWDVPAEAIAQGEYTLPEMMGVFDMYMAHHETYDPNDPFPVPQLRVTMTCTDGGEETTEEYSQALAEELGWSARAADGAIRFSTYESDTPISARIGTANYAAEAEELESGELLVVVQINGELVPESRCTVSLEDETWQDANGEDITFYYYRLTVPQQGESGTAVVTVCQKLTGYDTVWTESVEVEY